MFNVRGVVPLNKSHQREGYVDPDLISTCCIDASKFLTVPYKHAQLSLTYNLKIIVNEHILHDSICVQER